jgi:hypothetical protein
MSNRPPEIPFIEFIQNHERAWGNQTYSGRPSLAELLDASVMLVWQPNDPQETRQMVTVHQSLDEVNKYAARLLIQNKQDPLDRRLQAVYVDRKRATIRGVKVDIVPDGE